MLQLYSMFAFSFIMFGLLADEPNLQQAFAKP